MKDHAAAALCIGGALILVFWLSNRDPADQSAAIEPPTTHFTPRTETPSPLPAYLQVRPVDPSAYDPYDQKSMPKAFARWGSAGIERINRLRKAAAEKAAANTACDKVELAELSDSRSSYPRNPVVFVDCANGERFYIAESDLGGAIETQVQKSNRYSPEQIEQECIKAVRAKLNFPGTFSKDWFSTSHYQAPTTGNRVVNFTFTAKNALGVELPSSARCVQVPGGVFSVEIGR